MSKASCVILVVTSFPVHCTRVGQCSDKKKKEVKELKCQGSRWNEEASEPNHLSVCQYTDWLLTWPRCVFQLGLPWVIDCSHVAHCLFVRSWLNLRWPVHMLFRLLAADMLKGWKNGAQRGPTQHTVNSK